MKTFTQKWAIISLLENAKEGSEFYYTDFPLHVTLAGVFATDKTGKQLAGELTSLLADQQSIDIETDEKDMFGPNKDIAVMKIKKTAELMDFYKRIYVWLKESGAEYNSPEYQGEGYVPHSTFQKTGKLKQGETRRIASVSIIDLYPNGDGLRRKIFKTINLHKQTWQAGRESSLLQDIINGTKTVEGRLCRDKFAKYQVGDFVSLREDVYDKSGMLVKEIPDRALVKITKIENYNSFKEMLETIGFKKATPRAVSLKEALAEYRKFYSPEDEKKYGVVAIHIQLIS